MSCRCKSPRREFTLVLVPGREFHSGTKSCNGIMSTRNVHPFRCEIGVPVDHSRPRARRCLVTKAYRRKGKAANRRKKPLHYYSRFRRVSLRMPPNAISVKQLRSTEIPQMFPNLGYQTGRLAACTLYCDTKARCN